MSLAAPCGAQPEHKLGSLPESRWHAWAGCAFPPWRRARSSLPRVPAASHSWRGGPPARVPHQPRTARLQRVGYGRAGALCSGYSLPPLLAARTPVVAFPARRRSLAAFATDTSADRATSNQKPKRAVVAARHTAHRLGSCLRDPQHPGAVRHHHVRRDLAYYVQERAELAPRPGEPCLRPWLLCVCVGGGGGDRRRHRCRDRRCGRGR